jgi:2-polyprenyl-3-methyl-5-hydroxy-6-metoxy-1,4-benzoquinol methylase
VDSCILCKTSGQLSYFIDEAKVILCNNCKCLFKETVYKKSSHNEISSKNKIKNMVQKSISKSTAEHYVKYLKLKTDFSFKSSLDIGAGFGNFVSSLNRFGVDAHGVESDKNTHKNRVTEDIQLGFFDETFESEMKFDLISFNQSLYYFKDVFAILDKATQLLNKNGILLITSINPESDLILKNKFWIGGCNALMSKKNFKSLENLGLQLMDISSFNDNLYVDFRLRKDGKIGKFTFWRNFLLCSSKLKNMISFDEHGVHNYVLLKKLT